MLNCRIEGIAWAYIYAHIGMFIQDWPLAAATGTVRNGGPGRARRWPSYVTGVNRACR